MGEYEGSTTPSLTENVIDFTEFVSILFHYVFCSPTVLSK